MSKWNVGKPGGPSGPFYSVVSSEGQVIAMQIPDKKNAERIAKIPNLAEVDHRLGRYFLVVNGLYIAMEGETIRDMSIHGSVWNKETLQQAADLINGVK